MSESNRAKERKCTCIQLLQLLLQMAYLRCCFRFILAVWLRLVPFVGSSVTLFLSGATGTASVSCLLRHAEGSRADCAIEQPNSLFLPLPFGVWCLALALPSSAIRACAESPLPPRDTCCAEAFVATAFRIGPKNAAPSPPHAPRAKGRARGAWPHPPRRWHTARAGAHGASYPVALLKWGPGPRRIALGKKLAPCEEHLHPGGAGFALVLPFSLVVSIAAVL